MFLIFACSPMVGGGSALRGEVPTIFVLVTSQSGQPCTQGTAECKITQDTAHQGPTCSEELSRPTAVWATILQGSNDLQGVPPLEGVLCTEVRPPLSLLL